MDRLWSPWRSEYISSGVEPEGCIFCNLKETPQDDESNFVLHRASENLIVLNKYPYISGHLLVVPYEHVGDLDALPKKTSDELMDLTKRCQTALRDAYKPTGINVGMNIGRSAGAGVVDHVHVHVLPRWVGDTNFMTSVANTRVLPEDLETTYNKLRLKF